LNHYPGHSKVGDKKGSETDRIEDGLAVRSISALPKINVAQNVANILPSGVKYRHIEEQKWDVFYAVRVPTWRETEGAKPAQPVYGYGGGYASFR